MSPRRALLILLATSVLFVAPNTLTAQDKAVVRYKKLSKKLDELYRSKASKGEMTMTIITPHYKRTLTMQLTSRGTSDTLIRIKSPRKERGISTLKKGNEMWNYLPKIRKVVRVPPSMMMGSWMGSDMSNDDLVHGSSFEKDYTITSSTEGAKEHEFCFASIPKPKAAVTWSKVISCFDKKSELPVHQDFYDEKGRKVRQMLFSDVRNLGGRTIPTTMTVLPLSGEKKGNRTIMHFNKMDYNATVSDATFSLANLKRGR